MTQDEPKPGEKPAPEKDSRPDGRSPADWRALLWFVFILLFGYWLFRGTFEASQYKEIAYSEFKSYVADGAVIECELRESIILGKVDLAKASNVPGEPDDSSTDSDASTGGDSPDSEDETLEKSEQIFEFRTNRVDDPDLIEQLESADVKYDGSPPSIGAETLISWGVIILLMVIMWRFLSRRMSAAEHGVMGFGKSRAKLVADRDTGVTFDDVAGCEEAKYELQEVVDFLQHPEKYTSLGAKIPKGVLLVGPPGTGKTLLARAVAGQAGVPFFSLSGSDFVEMFVGVGAARVRDLFQQATRSAPCIVFIDELDAIGRQRGIHIGSVNDEREHTLNQLLVELDGFETNLGVIILAATNRPDVLDRALLRPGRFDRQVVLDAPDVGGRQAILAVHARDKPLDDNVDLQKVAQATPGFSGADLANVMNEAALLSARQQSKTISQANIEEAVEKVVAGPERKSRRLEPNEKERVAYHEVGHALVGFYSKHADPVHKISIVPRGRAALGYTLQLPTGDRFLLTRSELMDRMRGLLGGRAAEETKYGEVSTGAENDLQRATAMARQMVSMYGMSDKVGLSHCGHRSGILTTETDDPMQLDGTGHLDCSPDTANLIDAEVKLLLDKAYADAKQILSDHRDQLERVTQELLKKETLDAEQLRPLLGEPS